MRARVRTSFVLPVYASLYGRVLIGGKVPTVRSVVYRKLYITWQSVKQGFEKPAFGKTVWLYSEPNTDPGSIVAKPACEDSLEISIFFFETKTMAFWGTFFC